MRRFGFFIAFSLVLCLLATSFADFAEAFGVHRWWQTSSAQDVSTATVESQAN